MTKWRTIAALVFFTFAAVPSCSKPNADPAGGPPPAEPSADRVQGWLGDVDYLTAEIRKQHYVYKSRPLPEAFDRRVGELKGAIPRFSDERILLELLGLMKELGDGHSYVLPILFRDQPTKCLPLQLYLFSDGLFVVSAEKGYENWVGRQITRLGPMPVSEAIKRVAEFSSRDNDVGVSWVGPFLLRLRGMFEVLGLEPGSAQVRLGYRTQSGGEAEEAIDFIPVPRFHGIPKLGPAPTRGTEETPRWLRQVSLPYWFERLEGGTLYLQFNQVMDAPDEPLAAFAHRLETALGEQPPALLVIDVRHNNGGNGDLLPPLIAVLKTFEAKQPAAKLVVLTGRNTFSAAQIFIGRVDHETKALFAGEMSSSKPNFVGEENEIVLPWSHGIGSISNRFHESIPGDRREGIEPDLKVEVSSADYFGNRDPVLEAVLRTYGPGAKK